MEAPDENQESVIWVKFVVPGWHHWPNAKGKRAYLGETHRHLFHVVVRTVVHHDDREIEFHDLLDEARTLFEILGPDMGARSCEMMAREVGTELARRYGRAFEVSVAEDGEVGAAVVSVPPQA